MPYIFAQLAYAAWKGVEWYIVARSLVMEFLVLAVIVLAGSIFEAALWLLFSKKEKKPLPIDEWLADRYLGLTEEFS